MPLPAVLFALLLRHILCSAAQDVIGMTFSTSLSKIKFERAGLAAGWLCFLDLAVLFWPIARNSFLHQLVGVPYPVLIRFHR